MTCAAQYSHFALDELVEELREEQGRLEVLDGDHAGVRAVLSRSYRSLSPEAAAMFRVLGLLTGSDIGLPAAAALVGRSGRETRKLLAELVKANLLEQRKPRRYAFHSLLRRYAAECVENDEAPHVREAAIRRLLDHYLRSSWAADHQFLSKARPFTHSLPASGVAGLTFADDDSALQWWETEYDNIVAAVQQASKSGLQEHT